MTHTTLPPHLHRVQKRAYTLVVLGLATFAVSGVGGGMLADAGWRGVGNASYYVTLAGWLVAAAGLALNTYIFYASSKYP